MTLRRRLTLFVVAILLLSSANVALVFWANGRRGESVSRLHGAVAGQLGLLAARDDLVDRRREISILEGLRVASREEQVDPEKLSSVRARVVELRSRFRDLRSKGGEEPVDPDNALDGILGAMLAALDAAPNEGVSSFEIVLGVRLEHGAEDGGPRVELGPDPRRVWRLGEQDRVIVLAQQVYR